MEPTEILSMAHTAAQLIRITKDPETTLRTAYSVLERDPPMDQDESLAIRITRLLTEAHERRRDVLEYLRSQARGLLNRPVDESITAQKQRVAADPKALSLLKFVEAEEEHGLDMFPQNFGAFGLAKRSMLATYGGMTVIERGGKRLTPEEAGEPRPGDKFHFEKQGLPVSVRALIDYPLEVPVLFTIETGEEPWSIWEICCAFAEEYVNIYEHSGRYGVWGHDLTDLCLERLIYFPQKKLIYPHVGS